MSLKSPFLILSALLFISPLTFADEASTVLYVEVHDKTSMPAVITMRSMTQTLSIFQPKPPVPVGSNSDVSLQVLNANVNISGEGTLELTAEDNSGKCNFFLKYNVQNANFSFKGSTSSGNFLGRCVTEFPDGHHLNITIQ